MKRYKMASVSGLRWYKSRPPDHEGGMQVMGENGEVVAYMPVTFNVRGQDDTRRCLLEVDADGGLVINGLVDMWVSVKTPDFTGDYNAQPQAHGLFEVLPDEESHIAGLTIHAESEHDLPVLGRILGGIDDLAVARVGR